MSICLVEVVFYKNMLVGVEIEIPGLLSDLEVDLQIVSIIGSANYRKFLGGGVNCSERWYI